MKMTRSIEEVNSVNVMIYPRLLVALLKRTYKDIWPLNETYNCIEIFHNIDQNPVD